MLSHFRVYKCIRILSREWSGFQSCERWGARSATPDNRGKLFLLWCRMGWAGLGWAGTEERQV